MASDPFTIAVDTRERYPYRFANQQVTTERRALPGGDYAVTDDDGELVAVVERKTLADLSKTFVDGSLAFAMAELDTVDRAAIVVEDRWADVFRLEHVRPGSSPTCSPRSRSATRNVPIVFCETRASRRNGRTASSARPVRSRLAEDEIEDDERDRASARRAASVEHRVHVGGPRRAVPR